MKIILCRLLSSVLLFTGCKKEKLTEATPIGANTFSCKINGKVFRPCKGGLFSDEPLFGNVSVSSGLAIARIYA